MGWGKKFRRRYDARRRDAVNEISAFAYKIGVQHQINVSVSNEEIKGTKQEPDEDRLILTFSQSLTDNEEQDLTGL